MNNSLIGNPRQKQDYQLEVLEEEVLLFHPNSTEILHFNPSASLVWQLCTGDYSAAEIKALLIEAYPEAAEEIPTDVDTILTQFLEHQVIEFVEG